MHNVAALLDSLRSSLTLFAWCSILRPKHQNSSLPFCFGCFMCKGSARVCKTPWGKAETSRVGGRRGWGGILPKLGFHAIVGWSQSPLIFGTIGTIEMIRSMIWKIAQYRFYPGDCNRPSRVASVIKAVNLRWSCPLPEHIFRGLGRSRQSRRLYSNQPTESAYIWTSALSRLLRSPQSSGSPCVALKVFL